MKRLLIVPLALVATLTGAAVRRVQDTCGPFTDVSAMYCPYILEVYYVGISAGSSATTFSPDVPITRGQAAVFAAKTLNQSLSRNSRRAALGRWSSAIPWGAWFEGVGTTPLPNGPAIFGAMASDGTDIWVGDTQGVSRFRASDGRFLESWTTDQQPAAIVIGLGLVLVAGFTPSGTSSFYVIDPRLPAGAAQKVADLPAYTTGLTFVGGEVWAVNLTGISIIFPVSSGSWQATNVTTGFQAPSAIVFDGQNVWVADSGLCALLQLDGQGGIQRTVSLGKAPCYPTTSLLFDGQNILLPSYGSGLGVVRPSDGSIIANLSVGGGLVNGIAFDGERLLTFCNGASQNIFPSVTLLRAADYSIIQTQGFSDIGGPYFGGAVSDGLNFWITAQFPGGSGPVLARY
jgi:S-layer homology domain